MYSRNLKNEYRLVKGTLSRFEPEFSSSCFVIRVNLLHDPCLSLFLYGLLLSLWRISTLANYFFQVSFNLKIILCVAKM